MIRKTLSILVAAVLLLAGCSASSESEKNRQLTGNLDPQNPVTVTLWHYYVGENQQELDSAVSEFNRTQGIGQGIVVEAVAMGSIADLEANITNSAMGVISARPMPQIFSSYPDKVMEIDAMDMLVDIGQYLTEEEREGYVAEFLDEGMFGDRLLLLPVVRSTELLYVNGTAWGAFAAAVGMTADSLSTWESVYDTARTYYRRIDARTPEAPWDGSALIGFDSVANFLIIGGKQLGVDIIDASAGASGQVILDEAVLRRLFDIYYRGMALGYFGAEGKFRSDDIKAGKLIAYVGSSSSAAYFPTWIERYNVKNDIDFLALPYPVFQGGESYAIQQGAGMCVAKSTPAQQEGAALFLKWFTETERNVPFAMTTGYLPVQAEAYDAEIFDGALNALRDGGRSQRNVARVYEIALWQITESGAYAAAPFSGSYDARRILQSTLIDAALEGKELAEELQRDGASEEAVLKRLDPDARFQEWMEELNRSLANAGIEFART